MALTGKRLRFAQEYAIDHNATQAAIRAGYSARSAHTEGSRLLKNAEVRAQLGLAELSAAERANVSTVRILEELKRIATVDVGQAFDEDGNLKPIKDIPPDVRRAIAGIEVDELFEGRGDSRTQIGVTKKLKFWDKNKALELIGRHLAMFLDRTQHSVDTLTLEQLVELASKPAKKDGEP
jgi:phage terminase small subunit